MKYIYNTIIIIYMFFLCMMITVFSISDYEWMIGESEITNLCQLPMGGRYTLEPMLVILPLLVPLFIIRNKKIRYLCILIAGFYIYWSFFLRFNLCIPF
ncbi:DUF2645 family protein [Providencia stuartii]|uniref:DUF2645 family protein n=1 Tax=Providencia stuartii TaxID=588 RepID=UPI0012B61496|nr:DUF2645 family protein [Providencia stuartii]MTC21256.1 DUF2645 family protein [Providencia stuartii]